jgi:hypothetical protein
MACLQLQELTCKATQEWTGPDEVYLLINGIRVWGPQSMNDGDEQRLGTVRAIKFTKTAEIKLYDEDTAVDPDDRLGTITVNASEAGGGVRSGKFERYDANYELLYKVTDSLNDPCE